MEGIGNKNVETTAKHANNKTINMSKREWFAGIAMQAILSNNEFHLNYENIAIEALRYADALIKKLDKDV